MKKSFVLLFLALLCIVQAAVALNMINFTGYPQVINISVNNNTVTRNLTFIQKPYIMNSSFRVKMYNVNSSINETIANDITCLAGTTSCSAGADGDYSGLSYAEYIGYTSTYYLNYTRSVEATSAKVYASFTVVRASVHNTISIGCADSSGSFQTIYTNTQVGTWSYVNMVDLPNTCLERENVALIFNSGSNSADAKHRMFDAQVNFLINYTADIEEERFIDEYNETNPTSYLNITSLARTANNDHIMYFNFRSNNTATFETNLTLGYYYTRNLNITILDGYGNKTNISCSFNNQTVYPLTDLLIFNSTKENYLECYLFGWSPVEEYLTPESESYTFIMTQGEVQVSIYDEQTNLKLNRNFTFTLIHPDYAEITSVVDNKTFLDIPPGELEFLYRNTLYTTRSYYFTQAGYNASLRFYALNATVAEEKSFFIEDEEGTRLENATFKLLRGFIENNSQVFRVVEMDKSNFQGIASATLDPDVRYKILVEYMGNVIYSSPTDYKFTQSSYTVPGSLQENTLEDYFLGRDVSTSLSNSSNIYSYTINDPSSTVTNFCLEVNQISLLNPEINRCTSCLAASTGSVSCNISSYVSGNVTLELTGYFYQGEYREVTQSQILEFRVRTATETSREGPFWSIFIIMILVFIGLVIFGLQGAVIGLDLGFVVSKLTYLIDIDWTWLMGILAMSAFILYIMGDQ